MERLIELGLLQYGLRGTRLMWRLLQLHRLKTFLISLLPNGPRFTISQHRARVPKAFDRKTLLQEQTRRRAGLRIRDALYNLVGRLYVQTIRRLIKLLDDGNFRDPAASGGQRLAIRLIFA